MARFLRRPDRSASIPAASSKKSCTSSPRNEETKDLLSRMAEQIDREELSEAKKTLGEVEEKLGQDDPEVTGANTLINLLESTQ